MRQIWTTVLVCISGTATLAAQDTIPTLETAVITSSMTRQQQRETGRNIQVLTSEQLQRLPVHSVDELLRFIPGLEVQQRGPQGSQSDINLRGGTFQQVLVLLDGVRLNDPLTGHFSSYIPIHPAEIERIEVLKGPASALYGSEAVGGVINIITKTFAAAATKKENSGSAFISAGEYRMLNSGAHFALAGKGKRFSAGYLSNNAEGQALRGTTGYFHLHTFSIAGSVDLGKNWTASLRSSADLRSFNAQNFYTTFASDTANEKVNSWWTQAQLKHSGTKGTLQADLAWKQLRDQYWFRPTAVPNDNKSRLFSGQVFYHYAPATNWSILTSVQSIYKSIRSNDRGNHADWHGAVFTVVRQQFRNRIFLQEGLRLDYDENYGWVLIPQINAGWSAGKFAVRAVAGRTVRDADYTELYNNYNKALVTSGRIGNPALSTEKAWNLELGFDYYHSANLHISSTVFHRNYTGLIDWAPTPYAAMPRTNNLVPGGSYALAKNIESIQSDGLELDINYRKDLNRKMSFFVQAGYVLLHSSNADSIPSFYISSHARQLLNFSVLLRYSRIELSVNGLYKKRNAQELAALRAKISGDYAVVNTRAAFLLPRKFGRVYVQADNLFNTTYSDLLGSTMPGRWWSAGWSGRF